MLISIFKHTNGSVHFEHLYGGIFKTQNFHSECSWTK